MRVLIVAGEASGDVHAAKVARLLLKQGAKITAVGGDHLAALQVELLAHIDELSVVGVIEVIQRLPRILRVRRQVEQLIRSGDFDLLLTVDYPGLNLRLARTAHKQGLPVLHYIGPQVWAWRAHRLRVMRQNVNHVALVLPFEESLYHDAGVPATFVGHPLLDDPYSSQQIDCDLTLFPGSRKQEIHQHLPELLLAAKQYRQTHPALRLKVSLSSDTNRLAVEQMLQDAGFEPSAVLSTEPAGLLMRRTRASLVASGTATLEAALAGQPFAVFYRAHPLTFAVARRLVKVPWVSLANLVAEAPVIREFLQRDFNVDALVGEIATLLDDESDRQRIQKGCATIRQRLGQPGASQRVADLAVKVASEKRRNSLPRTPAS